MFCTNCGKEVQEGLKFCTHCGNKMFSQNACYVPKSGEVDVPPVVPNRKPEIHRGVSEKDYGKEDNGVTYGSVLVGIVVVAVILVAGFFLFIWEKPERKNEDVITANGQNEENAYYNYITGNGSNSSQTQTQARTEPITQATEAPTQQMTQIQYTGMEGTIQNLLESNFDFLEWYTFGTLNTTGGINSDNLVRVSDYRMSTWREFVNFVEGLYASSRAGFIVYKENKYWGPDGGLYVDPNYYTKSDYSITWDIYTIEINSQSNNRCEFKVTDSKTGHNAYGVAVYENGRWLLESEVY